MISRGGWSFLMLGMLDKKPFTRSQRAFNQAFCRLLRTTDFDNIRISDILRISEYSRSAFYFNYADKYDWAKKIYEHELEYYVKFSVDYSDGLEKGLGREQLVETVRSYLQHVYDNREIYELLCLKKIPVPPVDETCGRLKEMIDRERQFLVGNSDEDFDQDFYEYLKMCDSFEHIEYWRLHDFSFSPEEMARKVCAILRRREKI